VNTVLHRNGTRLRGFDYASSDACFVTICAAHKAHLFGEIADGPMVLNDVGQVVLEEWRASARIRPELALDEFVLMPNRLHGVVWMLEQNQTVLLQAFVVSGVGVSGRSPLRGNVAMGPAKKSLGALIANFKTAVTKRARGGSSNADLHIWQRSYHDHIVRNEADLERIQTHIQYNPLEWHSDEYGAAA
jgi:putative transposase